MIKYGEYITPEEYMALRKMVGWVEFPLEQAIACIEKANTSAIHAEAGK